MTDVDRTALPRSGRSGIEVPQADLDDLADRLARTRWTDEIEGAGWDYGTSVGYLKELTDYWRDRVRLAEAEGRAQPVGAVLGGDRRFQGPLRPRARQKDPYRMPILLLHGRPDSFYRFHKIIPMLTDPARFDGDPADSFDVVVPSLPGFGLFGPPAGARLGSGAGRGAVSYANDAAGFGYERYGAHGGDGGSPISQALARSHPESVVGIHITDIGYDKAAQLDPSTLSEAEKRYMEALEGWSFEEGGYVMIQGSRPQSLGYGLNDSPAGLAAWIVEKFRAWSDCGGERGTELQQRRAAHQHNHLPGDPDDQPLHPHLLRRDALLVGDAAARGDAGWDGPLRRRIPPQTSLFPGRRRSGSSATSGAGRRSRAAGTSLPWRNPTSWSVTCGRSSAASGERASPPRSLEGERPQALVRTALLVFGAWLVHLAGLWAYRG